uniref:hypothetical protein n=1 Tax=Paractinoplanes polyasparticus TaxID=2856853 RepID=UPI002106BF62|nr:hypothetical protein [Actinoplanes polyasparticus]
MTSFLKAVESKNHLIDFWSRVIRERGGIVNSDEGVRHTSADNPPARGTGAVPARHARPGRTP